MKQKSINPATEELLGEFEKQDFGSAYAEAGACQKAQQKWAKIPISERCTFLKKLAVVTREAAQECAKLMTLEMGKPITQSRAEIEKCAWLCEFYAEEAKLMLAPEVIKTEAKKSYIRFDPLGVVLGVMPWNFPFWQVYRFAVPALAAGNGAVLKHASNVPQCALKLEELFVRAGFPKGLFKTLLIDAETSDKLIESDAITAVSLTGSTPAGASVAMHAGKQLKKCVLELGGSDPFIVLKDADINLACKTALLARTINTGQSCIAAKRFILEQPIAAEFEEKMVEHFKTLVVGNPMEEKTTIGPLAKRDIRTTLVKQVNDAIGKGARVLTGGHLIHGKGYFFEPTLLTNITPEMAVYREEVFGPVMTIFTVKNAEEAVNLSNASEYGLGASVWTQNIAHAEELAAQIESGFVSINAMVKSDPRLPFGGVKKSGYGRELGSYGIKEFVNIKTVVVN